jgi:hypothetical protein
MQQLVRLYYLATPAFLLADWLWGVNVRVAFLDSWPAARYVYYAVCCVLGLAAWRRPAIAGAVGVAESGANIALLILSVYAWYWGALDALAAETASVPAVGTAELINFVLAAAMAAASYTVQRARLA